MTAVDHQAQAQAESSTELPPQLTEPILRRIFEYAIIPPAQPFVTFRPRGRQRRCGGTEPLFDPPLPSLWSKAARLEAEKLKDEESRRTQTWAWSLLGALGKELQVSRCLDSSAARS